MTEELNKHKLEHVQADHNRSTSKIDLSSFIDLSDVMKSEHDELHPRKYDSKTIQTFKKKMLETVVKPVSWKAHRDKIIQTQAIFSERQRAFQQHIMKTKEEKKDAQSSK